MTLPTVLCVDDEPNVLHGLRRALRGAFDIYTAGSGAEALRLLESGIDPAVICSDMRMPEMDGATFLAHSREVAPDASRVLLSGHADIESLSRVINDCGVFRFLIKPVERPDLLTALRDAAEQHRLVRSERELLEGTLVGSLQLLSQALSLASPDAFGRGQRVEQIVHNMAEHEGVELGWEDRTASSLACLGTLAIPGAVNDPETGEPPDDELINAIAPAGADLIEHIPRLQTVAETLRRVGKGDAWIEQSLHAAIHFVWAWSDGLIPREALEVVQDVVDPRAYDTLWTLHCRETQTIKKVWAAELEEGMTLLEPVRTRAGVLLMPAGITLTTASMIRLRNFGQRYGLVEPIRVEVTVTEEEAALPAAS